MKRHHTRQHPGRRRELEQEAEREAIFHHADDNGEFLKSLDRACEAHEERNRQRHDHE